MAKFITEFYDRATGCHFAMAWADEQQYLAGKAFLDELTDGCVARYSADRPDLYILETEEQREAMLEFRRQVREASNA
jgi:hypothetical protein